MDHLSPLRRCGVLPHGEHDAGLGVRGSALGFPISKGLECRIPRLHSPVNSRRFPETFVEHRFLLFAPEDFRRKPEPVPRTRVLS